MESGVSTLTSLIPTIASWLTRHLNVTVDQLLVV